MSVKSIVFVNPPLTLKERYADLECAGAVEPPFGLCYLAGVTRELGYRTHIVDAQALGLSVEETAASVLKLQPDYAGITAATPAIVNAARVAGTIKKSNPAITVIIGGCHVSAIPEETLNDYGGFDIAVVGEGEATISELLQGLDLNAGLEGIPGLARRSGGKAVRTGKRPLIKVLDTLPMPAFDLLPQLDRYYCVTLQSVNRLPAVSLITSRGCPCRCTFCDTSAQGIKLRWHSAEYVVKMMRALRHQYGIRCIMFEDDNFLFLRERMKAMALLLQKERLDMTWSCNSRVDDADTEILKLARESGCWQVMYGIESGSQKILDFYKKRITIEQISMAVKMSREAGLRTKGFIMVGNPLETEETLRETLALVKSVPLDDISITYFTPYPGAEIFGFCGEYGGFERNWEKMSCFEIVFLPRGMSDKTLDCWRRRIFREFYFRPRIIHGYLKRIRSWRHFSELSRLALSLARYCFEGFWRMHGEGTGNAGRKVLNHPKRQPGPGNG